MSSVGVCFFVVMMREMVEGLKSIGCIGVVRDSIFAGAEEIF